MPKSTGLSSSNQDSSSAQKMSPAQKNQTRFEEIKQHPDNIWMYGVNTKKGSGRFVIIKNTDGFWKKIAFILKWWFGPISRSKDVIQTLMNRVTKDISQTVKDAKKDATRSPSRLPLAANPVLLNEPVQPSKIPSQMLSPESKAIVSTLTASIQPSKPVATEPVAPTPTVILPVNPPTPTPQPAASSMPTPQVVETASKVPLPDDSPRLQTLGTTHLNSLRHPALSAASSTSNPTSSTMGPLQATAVQNQSHPVNAQFFQIKSNKLLQKYLQNDRTILSACQQLGINSDNDLVNLLQQSTETGKITKLWIFSLFCRENLIDQIETIPEDCKDPIIKIEGALPSVEGPLTSRDIACYLSQNASISMIKGGEEFQISLEDYQSCCQTLLDYAFEPNSKITGEVVAFLLQQGADIFHKNIHGISAFETAIPSLDSPAAFHLLLHYLSLPAEQKTREREQRLNRITNYLIRAIRFGTLDIARALYQHNPSLLFQSDNEGLTPLHHAVEKGSPEIVSFLIEMKSKINAKTKESDGSRSPLHLAAKAGSLEILKLLVNAGAEKDILDKEGDSPLAIACHEGRYDVALFLIQQGADPQLFNKDGCSAFHLAQKAITTAIDQTSKDQLQKIIDLLRQQLQQAASSSSMPNSSLYGAIESGNMNELERLLRQPGIDVNERDSKGNTPLILAAETGNIEMVRLLLAHKAEINGKNNAGWGALMRAGQLNHLGLVSLLLEAGASIVFAKQTDSAHGSHQDWMYHCSPEVLALLKHHVERDPIPSLFANNPTLRQSSKHGNCFLMAALDSLLSSPQNKRAVESLFRASPNGIEVRIRHPRNLLFSASQGQRDELQNKYSYRYDDKNQESVFTLDRLRLHVIDISELGVMSNSLGVKILERLANYLYTTDVNFFMGSILPNVVNKLTCQTSPIFGVSTFIEQFLDVKVEHGMASKTPGNAKFTFEQIQEIMKKSPGASIFIGMNDPQGGTTQHVWALDTTSPYSSSQRWSPYQSTEGFNLRNPWDTTRREFYTFDQICNLDGFIGIITPKKEESELLLAVKRGQEDLVRTCLNRGASLDVKDENGKTLLEIAENPAVKQLLQDHQNALNTKLENAVMSNNLEEAVSAVKAGASLDREKELLNIAMANQNSDQVKLLKNITDNQGITPLMRAIERNDLAAVQQLLRLKVNIKQKDCNGYNALHYAVCFQDPEILKTLLLYAYEFIDEPISRRKIWTPLHLAIGINAEPIAEILIQAGANLNQKTEGDGENTPLHLAVLNKNLPLIHLLINAGADPSTQNGDGQTPLDLADAEEMKAVLSRKAASSSSQLQCKKTSPVNLKETTQAKKNIYLRVPLDPVDYDMNICNKLIVMNSQSKEFASLSDGITRYTIEQLYSFGQSIQYQPPSDSKLMYFMPSLIPTNYSMKPSSAPPTHPTIKIMSEEEYQNYKRDRRAQVELVFTINADLPPGLAEGKTLLTRDRALLFGKMIAANSSEIVLSLFNSQSRNSSTQEMKLSSPLPLSERLGLVIKYGIAEEIPQMVEEGAFLNGPLEGGKTAQVLIDESRVLTLVLREKLMKTITHALEEERESLKNVRIAEQLYTFSKEGKIDEIEQLITQLQLSSSEQLLTWCLSNNLLDAFIALIDLWKIPLNTDFGNTLLVQAAAQGSSGLILALIEKGANPDNHEALMAAGKADHPKAVAMLIGRGAKLNIAEFSPEELNSSSLLIYLYPMFIDAIAQNDLDTVDKLARIDSVRNQFCENNDWISFQKEISDLGMKGRIEFLFLKNKYPTLSEVAKSGSIDELKAWISLGSPTQEELRETFNALIPLGLARYHVIKELIAAGAPFDSLINQGAASSTRGNLSTLILNRALEENNIFLLKRLQEGGMSLPSTSSLMDSLPPIRYETGLRSSKFGDKEVIIETTLIPSSHRDKPEPQSIILLIDVSGSMDRVVNNGTLKNAIDYFAEQLPENNTLTMITFSDTGKTIMQPVKKDRSGRFMTQVRSHTAQLKTEGGTNFTAAFSQIDPMSFDPDRTRILFLTDGEGQGTAEELTNIVKDKLGVVVPIDTVGMTEGCNPKRVLEGLNEQSHGLPLFIKTQNDINEAFKKITPYFTSSRTPSGKVSLLNHKGQEIDFKTFSQMPIDGVNKTQVLKVPVELLSEGYTIRYAFDNGTTIEKAYSDLPSESNPEMTLRFLDSEYQKWMSSKANRDTVIKGLRDLLTIADKEPPCEALNRLKETINLFINSKSRAEQDQQRADAQRLATQFLPSILPTPMRRP